MKAFALFGTFVVARLLVVAGRELPASAWTPLALFWQDALVALLFGVMERFGRRTPVVVGTAFWIVVAYTAVNVVLARVLSSPLTWPMINATGGALSDSITHYLTPGNIALMAAVGLAGALFLVLARRIRPEWTTRWAFGALPLLILSGLIGARQIDCGGSHRNALVTLVDSALPHLRHTPNDLSGDWRPTAFSTTVKAEDLTRLRGAAQGRHVVMIGLESTGASYLRCYGAKQDPTPNLTQLAKTSVLFENAYAVYPESIKGLFSVMCSRYPAFDTRAENYAHIETPAVAEVLSHAGWRTALFHSGRFDYLGMNAVIQGRGFETLVDAGGISGNFNSSFGVDEPATVERMLEWIDGLPRGQRFFLHYLPIAGHHPYETPAPGPFPESTDAGQYLNALHFGDAALGRFLEGLRVRGLETNTLFVIYGDHGEAFGQHEGNYGHTLFLYEENVRVPLLFAAPDAGTATRVQRTASLIDVAPTMLQMLGVDAPSDYQGVSLLEPHDRAALFFTDYSQPLVGLREGRWKLIAELGTQHARLFDLETDPQETRNVAGLHPTQVDQWRRQLEAWAAAQKALVLRRNLAARK